MTGNNDLIFDNKIPTRVNAYHRKHVLAVITSDTQRKLVQFVLGPKLQLVSEMYVMGLKKADETLPT